MLEQMAGQSGEEAPSFDFLIIHVTLISAEGQQPRNYFQQLPKPLSAVSYILLKPKTKSKGFTAWVRSCCSMDLVLELSN